MQNRKLHDKTCHWCTVSLIYSLLATTLPWMWSNVKTFVLWLCISLSPIRYIVCWSLPLLALHYADRNKNLSIPLLIFSGSKLHWELWAHWNRSVSHRHRRLPRSNVHHIDSLWHRRCFKVLFCFIYWLLARISTLGLKNNQDIFGWEQEFCL